MTEITIVVSASPISANERKTRKFCHCESVGDFSSIFIVEVQRKSEREKLSYRPKVGERPLIADTFRTKTEKKTYLVI